MREDPPQCPNCNTDLDKNHLGANCVDNHTSRPVWIETYTGRKFNILEPRVEDVDIFDIAQQLSKINRYTGATREPYSVAQHSVMASEYLELTLETFETQLKGLLHDAAEAYIGDIHGPLKAYLHDQIFPIEEKIEKVIGERFGVELTPMHPRVKHADLVMLATEKRDMMSNTPWKILEGILPEQRHCIPWSQPDAAERYLRRFTELYKCRR